MSDIYSAMNEVMKQVGYVQKTRSGGVNYTFAGEAALIEAIRPHMVDNGIVVHPHQVLELRQDDYSTKSGAVMNRTSVIISYRFAHAESGTFIDVMVTGEGADVGDKSANKALTGAYKYALRQALMIETGDDPDKDASEPSENGRTAAPPPAKKDIKPPMPTAAMKRKFHAYGSSLYGDEWDDKRPELVKAISKKRHEGGPVTSSNDLYRAEMQNLIDGMESKLANEKEAESATGNA